ncbi:MAG TPA: aminoacetone oxidase family FAD-binding enzyme [Phycisphaerales bacterium]|nr:aminoacetone oxidase family FAD-binding enzyme [Phycisphaerales bacterium]
MPHLADIAVIGAGAAGLMAAIQAAQDATPKTSIILLDGAKRPGVKILVAGGGRCNVTHHHVDESAYNGSSRHAIRKVLGRFGVDRTIAFFADLGVQLKREQTGKLFPVTDDARTVLNALIGQAARAGAELIHPWRVAGVHREHGAFIIERRRQPDDPVPRHPAGIRDADRLHARAVILATGGMAMPRSGSDGHGYSIARALGHSVTDRVFPALVPLTLPPSHFLCALSGITIDAAVELRSQAGRPLANFTNSTLLTHFGLSGPSVLDISRHYLATNPHGQESGPSAPGSPLTINFLPGRATDELDRTLSERGRSPSAPVLWRAFSGDIPERLARAVCEHAGADPSASLSSLPREVRRRAAATFTGLELPITGDRGFAHAEVTAGGVPLSEIRLETMESRVCPGLFICGEIADVDGRIGGFNFQWAWASGYVAGRAAAAAVAGTGMPGQ